MIHYLEMITKMSNDDLKIYDEGSTIGRNSIEIRCNCTKKLLVIRSDPLGSQVTFQIEAKRIMLVCQCGLFHEIENKMLGDVTSHEIKRHNCAEDCGNKELNLAAFEGIENDPSYQKTGKTFLDQKNEEHVKRIFKKEGIDLG